MPARQAVAKMTVDEVMSELKRLGSEATKRVLMKHGAREPFYGVKIEDLKKIQKRIKHDHALALALYETGNSDAMYLAALIAEPERMTKAELKRWVKQASWHMISDCAVAWTAAESRYGWELGTEWIESDKEMIASAGWSTLSSLVSVAPDDELPFKDLDRLIQRVARDIHSAENRVRYVMNGFLISVACYVAPLTTAAEKAAKAIGKVTVDMGDTSCKVPLATEYIEKVRKMGRIGRKRASARC